MSELQRVLYVEDEPHIATVARLALERVGGLSVLICASGEAAVREAAGFAPDLILLDVMMPGMDGPATLNALRLQPVLAATPVAFMTAKVQPDEIDALRALGALAVIAKPFDPMGLAAEIKRIWATRPTAIDAPY